MILITTSATPSEIPSTPLMRGSSSWKNLVLGLNGQVTCVEANTGTTQWTTSLPKCGYGFVTVNMQCSQLFASTWGKLFILDPRTGTILHQDSLEGLGHHSILLASAQNPVPNHSSCTLIAETDVQRERASKSATTTGH
ncbi:hypothetical protein Pelo_19023 [Pelomyxa schiedti]|nr:hypothetical protein Pelo_19023 [Pelomyxa schiedti]